jgi:hypothetical protein
MTHELPLEIPTEYPWHGPIIGISMRFCLGSHGMRHNRHAGAIAELLAAAVTHQDMCGEEEVSKVSKHAISLSTMFGVVHSLTESHSSV